MTAVQEAASVPYASSGAAAEPSESEAEPTSPVAEPEELRPLYEVFLSHLEVLAAAPITAESLRPRLDLQKFQLVVWLRRALAERRLRKVGRPVRYQWIPEQGALSVTSVGAEERVADDRGH